ncbi:hypothetical protein [Frankia gtarii]|uniref:hypothetical protein n=1 Tax=Frankia gtarii TaxID=2950102 RepID=UPI0021BE1DBF|nr:hypothetical protein [Frankia gtarii]
MTDLYEVVSLVIEEFGVPPVLTDRAGRRLMPPLPALPGGEVAKVLEKLGCEVARTT